MKRAKISFYTTTSPGVRTRFPESGTCGISKRANSLLLHLSEWGPDYDDLIGKKNKHGAYQGESKNKKVKACGVQVSKDKFIREWREKKNYLIIIRIQS